MEVRPGLLVTPSVRLARPLDRGAMGEVWLADHLTLHTPVAVKLVARDSDAKQVALHRFRREATLAAQVRHPHALEIHDHGFLDDDTPFIVMELIEGPSLRQALSDGPFDSAELVALIRQVSGVLTAAHALGIVHRDIKPDNLMLVGRGPELFVKVVDFGIAKRFSLAEPDDATRSGAMLGTPRYLSPELVESAKEATPDADLWALAVVAYEALVGVPPFTGETLGSLCIHIVKGHHEPPSRLRGDLPPGIDAWFAKAFAPDVEDRFASAEEMAEAFQAAFDDSTAGASIVAPTRSTVAPSDEPTAPAPHWKGGLGAIAAVVAVLTVVGLGARNAEPEPAQPAPRLVSSSTEPSAEPVPEPSEEPIERVTTTPSSVTPVASSAPLPPPPPMPRPAKVTPKPSDSASCIAFDGQTGKWVYTCGSR